MRDSSNIRLVINFDRLRSHTLNIGLLISFQTLFEVNLCKNGLFAKWIIINKSSWYKHIFMAQKNMFFQNTLHEGLKMLMRAIFSIPPQVPHSLKISVSFLSIFWDVLGWWKDISSFLISTSNFWNTSVKQQSNSKNYGTKLLSVTVWWFLWFRYISYVCICRN